MLKNPNLKAILVNIFGGIMKCDVIAEGVVTAAKQVHLSVPLVVRMKGTNEELGKKILAESGLPIISADTMAQAAERVVAAAEGKEIPTGDGLGGVSKVAIGAATVGAGVAGVAASMGEKVEHVAEELVDDVKHLGKNVSEIADEAVETFSDLAHSSVEAVKNLVTGDDEKKVSEALKGAGVTASNVGVQATSKGESWLKRYWWLLPLALLLGWLLSQCGGKKPHDAPPPPTPAQTQSAAPVAAPAPKMALDPALVEFFKSKGASIALVNGKLTLSGEVADQATKDELLAKAKAALSALGAGVTLDDQLLVKGATASAGATLLKVNFATGSAQIPASAFAELDKFAATAKKDGYKGQISGHTDNTGDAAKNMALSDERAKAVVAYLVKKGVPEGAMTAKGYGSEKPIASNDSEEGRARNRRVEFAKAK